MDRLQAIELGPIRHEKTETGNAPLYFLSGKKMYEIGAMSGEYPPLGWRRPGFLVGKRLAEIGPEDRPQLAAHLLGEMGGVWSHPIKVVESLYFGIIEEGQQTWSLVESRKFVNHFAYADFLFEVGGMSIDRRDFIVEDEPALFITLFVHSNLDRPVRLGVTFNVTVNLRPSWFSGWPEGPDELLYRDGLIAAYDTKWPDHWGLAFGSDAVPSGHSFSLAPNHIHKVGTLSYQVHVEAGGTTELHFLLVAEHEPPGYPAAVQRFHRLMDKRQQLFVDKVDHYDRRVFGGTTLECSDKWFADAFHIAKANLLWLISEPRPYLGQYLYGGIPEYVQLFGTDTEYAIPGVVGVNFREVARESLLSLAQYADILCGRVPHEVTTNGHIFHPGNTQETPGFAIAAWNYFKWTGDWLFLDRVYPLCHQGVLDYVLAHWDMDLDYYPDGNSMVERLGMGSEKLDSACYFCKAIYCLASMAEALGHPEERDRHLELANALRAAINVDFWQEEESMWADSITEEHAQKLDGHWIVAVPMETGIAEPAKGLRSLDRIEREWVNQWGMVHTREKENLVWTLPTGVLALAEFRYGRGELGTKLLASITKTLNHGPLGTYKELIPEGLCFVQLWSPAIFLQGTIEGMFGVQPRADLDRAEIVPAIPSDWQFAQLNGLVIGEHVLDIRFERGKTRESLSVTHSSQGANFHCNIGIFSEADLTLAPTVGRPVGRGEEKRGLKRVQLFEVELEPGQRLLLKRTGRRVILSRQSAS
ncbi:MAG: hypothetical protein HYX94_08355 [Chloroflexi bacterium]|nr:hypothetical protein [Chloroflexota bacterium]